MKVFKFGGASLKDAAGVQNMANILRQHGGRNHLLVVVSAMGKTTNGLEEVWRHVLSGTPHAPALQTLKDYHTALMDDLFEPQAPIYAQVAQLWYKLEKECQTAYHDKNCLYDQIISFGEILSSVIISAYLSAQGVENQWIDARKYIQTDEKWREGTVDWDWTEKNVQAELPQILAGRIILTQGFIGGTISGKTTTLGREGSDYTAAIFAWCLRAQSVTIWKDVPGVLNADPRRIPQATLYDQLPYTEAAEMTYYGASVIHPKTIKPLQNRQIQLNVKSFLQPKAEGTAIGNFRVDRLLPAIIFKGQQSLLRFDVKDLSSINESGLSRIFNTISRVGLKINMMLNTAVSFSICTNTDEDKIAEVKSLLEKEFFVSVTNGLELLTIQNYTMELVNQYGDMDNVIIDQRTEKNYQIVRRVS